MRSCHVCSVKKDCVNVNETDVVLAKQISMNYESSAKEFTQTYRNKHKQRENPRKARTGSKAVKNGPFSREALKTH